MRVATQRVTALRCIKAGFAWSAALEHARVVNGFFRLTTWGHLSSAVRAAMRQRTPALLGRILNMPKPLESLLPGIGRLTRSVKMGQSYRIGDDIEIRFNKITGHNTISVTFVAPKSLFISHSEMATLTMLPNSKIECDD